MDSTKSPENGVSRRDFGKAFTAAGLAAMGSALSGPMAWAAEQEADLQKRRAKHVTTLESAGYQIDNKRYKRFETMNNAFNAYSRDIGQDWYLPWFENRMKAMSQGKSCMATDVGNPDVARTFAAVDEGLNTINLMTGPYGTGYENTGLLSWNNPMYMPGMTLPYMIPGAMPTEKISEEQLTLQAKVMARLTGADLVGICKLDRQWVYESNQKNS